MEQSGQTKSGGIKILKLAAATLLTTSFLCVLVMPFSGVAQKTTTRDVAGITAADTKKDESPAPSPKLGRLLEPVDPQRRLGRTAQRVSGARGDP